MAALPHVASGPPSFRQPRDDEGRFLNLDPREPHGFGDFLRWQLLGRLTGERRSSPGRAEIPRVPVDAARLWTPPVPGEGARVTWLGHSSFLVQMDGLSLLIDPALMDRMGPLGIVRRNMPPAMRPDELPPVDAVLVTHNHYDHMDLPTLRAVGAPVLAGLGNEALLEREGLTAVAMGWWQWVRYQSVTITFVPAQHFSQRGARDRDRTLWGGFVVAGSSATLYHAGDTAYFSGFQEIGRRFPRIDAALVPIGAYDPRWFMRAAHVNPEEALAAFLDLGARTFVAMHWGTFKQTDEPLDEPPRRLEAERTRLAIPPSRVRVPAVGETLEVRSPPNLDPSAPGG